MIIALWNRWRTQKQWWWLALLRAVLILYAAIGSWLIAWELEHLWENW